MDYSTLSFISRPNDRYNYIMYYLRNTDQTHFPLSVKLLDFVLYDKHKLDICKELLKLNVLDYTTIYTMVVSMYDSSKIELLEEIKQYVDLTPEEVDKLALTISNYGQRAIARSLFL